jgi:hypothetical protein
MQHIDYDWDLDTEGINFDEELNVDYLGWNDGDIFKLITENGRKRLIKVDDVEAFARGHKVNGQLSRFS